MTLRLNTLPSILFALAASALTGCGLGSGGPLSPTQTAVPAAVSLKGTVFGGSQAIGDATIQLYAAGSTGYGSAYSYATGTSLLGNNVVQTASDGTGSFSLQNTFTCPAGNPEVYLVATGGNPGLTNGTNTNIALMAALGPCLGITSSTHIHINEMTTVASVWALSPFMTGIANLGSTASNATGLANAFATVNKLVAIGTGLPGGSALPANAVLPVAKMNTLADALAACVNSPGGTAGSNSSCGTLFTAATVGGVAPTDTITAAMNIAQHPGANVPAIWGLANSQSPFQSKLASAPTDWNLIVTYSGGGLSTPKGIAVDQGGNVWAANQSNNSVTKLDALGVTSTDATGFLSGSSGYTVGTLSSPVAVAIDLNGNAWVANNGNSTVTQIAASGSTGTVYNGGSLNAPSGLAVDASNNVWVANGGNSSVTEIGSGGGYTNYPGSGIASPTAIAINPK
jgi:hypothetical protein